MKKILFIAVFVFTLLPFCFSEDYFRVVSAGGIMEQPVSSRRMSERLNQAAAVYGKLSKIARTGVYDFVFGVSLDEYRKLNSYGVIMISAQSHDSGELPLKNAYFWTGKKKYRLVLLLSKKVRTLSDTAEKVFGKNREDYFYLLPYAFSRMTGQVCIDWGKNRSGFVVVKFPGRAALDYLEKGSDLLPDKKKSIDHGAFAAFLAREFSLTLEEQAKAVKEVQANHL